jgi:hypothetical protein
VEPVHEEVSDSGPLKKRKSYIYNNVARAVVKGVGFREERTFTTAEELTMWALEPTAIPCPSTMICSISASSFSISEKSDAPSASAKRRYSPRATIMPYNEFYVCFEKATLQGSK